MIQLLRDLATDFQDEAEIPLRQLIVNTHSPVLIANLFKHSLQGCSCYYPSTNDRSLDACRY